jgi:hypothetical protein
MAYQLKQNQSADPLLFLMLDASDHISPKTGLTPTVVLGKAGAAFAAPSGAVSEIGNGWYKVAGNATDTNTLGPLVLHATATGADPTDKEFEVVAYDPRSATNLGLSALPTASPAASGGLPTVDANNRIAGVQGTKHRFDDLNDIAATAVVSSGAITTSGGAVSTVGSLLGTVTLDASEDIYPADVQFLADDTAGSDAYTVVWFHNGVPLSSGITSPTIEAVRRSDASQLIAAATAMSAIGSTGALKYDTSDQRLPAGETAIVTVTATIDGVTRTWSSLVVRDSSAS